MLPLKDITPGMLLARLENTLVSSYAPEHLDVDEHRRLQDLSNECFSRIKMGQEKYGQEWIIKDNIKEAGEELLDAMNYITYMLEQLDHFDNLDDDQQIVVDDCIDRLEAILVLTADNMLDLKVVHNTLTEIQEEIKSQ